MISKFMCPGSVISFNKEMRLSINSVVLYFVRRGMDKVAKLTVPREYEDGGLRWPNTVFKCLCLIHHYF